MAEPTERRLQVAKRIAIWRSTAILVAVVVASPWLVFKDRAEIMRVIAILNPWIGLAIVFAPTLVAGAFLLFWREKLEQIPRERLISIGSWGHVASYLISFGLIVAYIKMVP